MDEKKSLSTFLKKNKKIIIFSSISVALIILLFAGFAIKNTNLFGNNLNSPSNDSRNSSIEFQNNGTEETNISEEANTSVNNTTNTTSTTPSSSRTSSNSCTPNCGGNVCGDDGCGGSCGTCGIWETCSAGSCVLSCTNDAGCSSAGSFCDGNITYSCSLEADGCYNRTNITECSSSEKCYTGSCFPFININSCQEIAESDIIYILNESIENNSLTDSCIQIINESITLDCEGNSITSTSYEAGIYSNQSNTIIKNCNISMGDEDGGNGIEITNTSNILIKNCTLNSQYLGVLFDGNVTNSTIENNTINNNSESGLSILESSNNTIKNNSFIDGLINGIYLSGSSENLIENNILDNNSWYGIWIQTSPGGSNTIRNNQIKSSETNLWIKTSNNIIQNNFINASTYYYGIYIYGATNNTLENNTVTYSSSHGIRIRNANNNTVVNNTVNFNQQYGIEFSGTSENNTVQENNFCSSVILDVSCAIDQFFGIGNKCSPAIATCGGICEIC